jgi:glycosyltransferase involved in cell wall biosynthesis
LTVTINGRFIGQPITGVQRYGREILAALDQQVTEGNVPAELVGQTWLLAVPKGTKCDLPLKSIQPREIGPFQGHLWEQTTLASFARHSVLLSLANSGPVLHRRHLVVLHDAGLYRMRSAASWKYRLFHLVLDYFLFRRATISTVSEFSRAELAEVSGLPARSIGVAANGCEHFRIVKADHALVDERDPSGQGYFLIVGSRAPHKNIATAIEAFRLLPKPRLPLFIVGGINSRVFAGGVDIGGEAEDIVYLGRVDDSRLKGLYERATALIFPSLYEGFGIPPLEAMLCDCPVLASTAPAVMETCGNAARYFDPRDPQSLASEMTAISGDYAVRDEMVRLGRRRIDLYSWDRSARLISEMLATLAEAK